MKKTGIRAKFLALTIIFALLILKSYFISHYLIDQKKEDESLISIATSQKVLVQSYVKNFFYFMETQNIQNVTSVVRDFEQNLKFLQGIVVPTAPESTDKPTEQANQEQKEPTKIAPELLQQLSEIEVMWGALKELAISLLAMNEEEKKIGYTNLIEKSNTLDATIGTLIKSYEQRSSKNFDRINYTQLIILFISIFVSIVGFILLNRLVVARAIERFVDLNDSASTMKDAIDNISSLNEEMGKSGQRLIESVSQTMSAVTQITQTAQKSSELTGEARAEAEKSMARTQEGNTSIQKVRQSLQQISDYSEQLRQNMEHGNSEIKGILDEVKKIGDQTKVINDIVFQTKLLSFNASVEAARAGESGKGFAVVAEEIGNLAVVSGQSSIEINSLLENSITNIEAIIEGNGRRLAESMTKTREGITNSIECGDDCARIFDQISNVVKNLDELISQVSASSSEQLEGVRHIEAAMLDISSGNEKHKDIVDSILQSSDKAKESTNMLVKSIKFFSELLLGQGK